MLVTVDVSHDWILLFISGTKLKSILKRFGMQCGGRLHESESTNEL